ncbi:MAG: hypothetical protein ACRCSQ_03520 [Bacteroidales bacterium]
MKKLVFCFFAVLFTCGISFAQNWGNGNQNGYYMGPGMMWDGHDSWMGPGMMWGNWHNDNWQKQTRSSLNLTTEQQRKWDDIRSNGQQNQQAVNDSISRYAKEIYRLQQNRSNMVQQDMSLIKQILTPEQYTLFLEKLVNMDAGK